MTQLLGLPVRWTTALGRFVGGLAPARLGDVVVARAGDDVVGVAVDTGRVAWRTTIDAQGGGGFVLARHGDALVVTDVRDRATGHARLVALDAGGRIAWVAALPGKALTWLAGDGATHAIVEAAPPSIATVDAGGRVTTQALPHPGNVLAPLGDGWAVGASGLPGKHPSLYALTAGGAVAAAEPAGRVFQMVAVGGGVLTFERRAGGGGEVVRRDPALRAVWRRDAAGEAGTIGADAAYVCLGDRQRPVPAALALDTGATRWEAEPLPDEPGGVRCAGRAVLFHHLAGVALFTDDGRCLGATEEVVGAPAELPGGLCLIVGSDLVRLGLS